MERPEHLQQFMSQLCELKLEVLDEQEHQINLCVNDFVPEQFLKPDLFLLSDEINCDLQLHQNELVSFKNRRLRYSHTKSAATTKAICHDLPQDYLFTGSLFDVVSLAAGLLKQFAKFGPVMGPTKQATNLFFFEQNRQRQTLEVKYKEDNKWSLETVVFDPEAVYPKCTRIFYPSSS